MNGIRLYMPITKVNPETREVTGLFTAEAPDRSKEVLDYATSVPYFKAWSDEVSKSSGGKSLGNVREMHTKSAVGKVTDLNFDDVGKVIEGTVKVVDDGAWEKVQEGVYTGFSIGGEYVKRWTDPSNASLKRYTAQPIEVSLVDLPCLPDATFSLVKRLVEKSAAGDVPREEVLETRAFKSVADGALFPHVEVDEELEQVWKARDGKTFSKKADAVKHNEELDANDARKVATQGVRQITDAAVAAINNLAKAVSERDGKPADELKSDEEEEAALDEGTRLQKEAQTIVAENPILAGYILDGLLEKAAGQNHLRLRKEMPEAFKENADKKDEAEDEAKDEDEAKKDDKDEKAEKGLTVGGLKKGLWDVGRVADALIDLNWIKDNLCWESEYEKDDSPLPSELGKIIGTLAMFLRSLVAEETKELMAGIVVEFADDGAMTVIKVGETEVEPSAALKELATGLAKSLNVEHLSGDLQGLAKAVNAFVEQEHANLLEKAAQGAEASEKLSKLGGLASNHESSPAGAPEALQKALGKIEVLEAENSVFKGTLEKITPTLEALQKRLAAVEAQPLPPKGVRVALNKSADGVDDSGGNSGGPIRGVDDLVEVLGKSALSSNEINQALMKHALRSPKTFGG